MRDRLPANPYRPGLLLIGIAQLTVTAQVLLAPRSFYEDFPFGRSWVEKHPAFNEHLLYDYGAFTLGAALALIIAAIWLDRRVVQLAIITWLVGASIHFTYHLIHVDVHGTADAIANMAALGLYLIVPGVLLYLSRERSAHANTESSGSTA